LKEGKFVPHIFKANTMTLPSQNNANICENIKTDSVIKMESLKLSSPNRRKGILKEELAEEEPLFKERMIRSALKHGTTPPRFSGDRPQHITVKIQSTEDRQV
jgi:hypothetical protein